MLDIIHTFASAAFVFFGTFGAIYLISEHERRAVLRTLYPPPNRNGGRGTPPPGASSRVPLASWLASRRR